MNAVQHERRRFLLSAALAGGNASVASRLSPRGKSVAAESAGSPQARLGINLSGPVDWNTELPFVDVFRLSRKWISQRQGAGWGQGPELALDDRGWVTRLESGCWAETPLCTIEGGHYPEGAYTIFFEGRGKLEFWGAGRLESVRPGELTVDVRPEQGGFWLRILETDPTDYVRNIRVVMPGFADRFRHDPFHPVFSERWQGVAAIRYMDWMHTNNSEIATWEQRSRPEDATFSDKGVAVETMIDLANRQQIDPWFCMPHQADDDYVRNFAGMVHKYLSPERTVYVEYSNEVWNGMFAQDKYAAERGIALGLADKPWEAAWRYNAQRSTEIFHVWQNVFGSSDRIVRVLASQAANPYVSEQILQFREAHEQADALAIAPYVSFNVPATGDGLTASQVADWTVEQALDHLEAHALPEAVRWMQSQKKVADKYGVKLIAYEAGQHMVGIQGGENNEQLTELCHAVNRDPRMGAIYDKYYQAWTDVGGDLLCHFSSVSQWGKYGSWGIMEYFDDDPAQSPKFMATMRWAKDRGQNVNVPG